MQRKLIHACAFVLGLSAASVHAGVIVSDSQYGLFGGSSGTREFQVATHGVITDVNFLVSFSKCNDPASGRMAPGCRPAPSGQWAT